MTAFREIAAGAIFILAMAAVITRPRRLDEAVSSAVGALAMMAVGAVGPGQALATLAQEWNLFLFFLGLMLIAGLADAAGFFDAAGALAAGAARGSSRLLLLGVFLIGAVITAFLSNDATALILTPVVYAVATRLRLPPLPYLFATTFVADTASMTLPVSNPINIIVSERAQLGLGAYTGHLLLASIMAIAINAALFLVVFRREARRRFDADWRAALAEVISNRRLFRLTCAGLGLVAAAYLVASAVRVPLGPVAVVGALLLALLALGARDLDVGRVRGQVSLSLFVYVAGLLVMVRGLESVGLTETAVGWLWGLAPGQLGAVGAGLLGGALGANLINNVPATLVLLAGAGPAPHLPFQLGVLAGADLGPNLTPVGSLSTMLWLVIVRRRGIEVKTLDYLKLGAIVTPVVLLATGLAIAATFR
ncbi:MAG: SLC13 family permease [Candidatus Dormibacteraeota bacterium]|nr:SLC13 family permease [Candidatus Dormibacteraeota bacterium]